MRWGAQPRWARWVSAVYVVGFVEGAGSHADDVINGGLHAYRGWPLPSQVLFHAILALDLLAALTIVLVRSAGPLLGAAVMAADLTANWLGNWHQVLRDPGAYAKPYGLSMITLFGLFVLLTARPLHRSFHRAGQRPPAVGGQLSQPGVGVFAEDRVLVDGERNVDVRVDPQRAHAVAPAEERGVAGE